MEGLEVIAIQKYFGENHLLQGVSFQQSKGEILALLGPSGSGKTTLLEIIAGLIEPDQGDCTWNGEPLLGIPAHQRGFGLMFQEYVLFPHKDVYENVAFGLKMAGEDLDTIDARVQNVLELVGLPGFGKREISTLSGGEQQRVALARSMAPEPRLVMLDEPLGALDRTIRDRLIVELKDILKDAAQTALYVTHDQEEAFLIADRVVILGQGKTAQVGTPQGIYYHPDSPYVAQFLGMTNFFNGEAQQSNGGSLLKSDLGTWPVKKNFRGPGLILLRPDRMVLGKPAGSDYFQLSGKLHSKTFSGQTFQILVQNGDHFFKYILSDKEGELPHPGENITLSFLTDDALHFFPQD
ncbi:MAG: ABC transporter ATP-binding protein [Anaerolineales bacterium]|nr:ABC transporter ATP-binding protein [Anaerolineales bacterium]